MINYNLRVLLASSRTLDALVQQGLLRRVHEQVPGASGEVFTVFGEQPEMLSHFHLRLGQNLIQAQLYTLPPEEYAGMLAASPAFTQNRVAHLLPALARPMSPEDKAIWVSSLVQAIQAGACPDSTPHLLAGRNVPLAHWFPEQTRFFRNSSGWFVSLFFAPPALAPLQGIDRSAVGIDVGLNTLAVSVYQSGLIHRAAGIQEVYLSAMELEQWCPDNTQTQQEVERHLRLLQHAAARLELHNMVSVLLSSASTVYWEDLHYRDCSPAFKRRSRELGLRDCLLCWLPKRLDAAGIHWQRVAPDHTSQLCHTTHLRGVRDNSDHRRFLDGNGAMTDADVNAARNILTLGLAYQLGRGTRYAQERVYAAR